MGINNPVMDAKHATPFEDAVSLTGFGKFNLFILTSSGGCLMCAIIETMCAMFITPAAQCDLDLSLTQKGVLYSIGFFGIVASSHIWGYYGDTKGRKRVIVITLMISAVISFIGSFVTVSWLFITLRFWNGFFVGGSSAITYAYIGEFHDSRFRPKMVSWIASFIAVGNIFLPGMAWLILPESWTYEIPLLGTIFRPWRLLMIIYTIPSVISSILISLSPESPKYLLTQGKNAEALEILRKMYVINTGKDPNSYPVSAILWNENNEIRRTNGGLLRTMWEQTKPLFQKSYYIKTILVCYLQFAIFFTSSSVIMWYPQILNMISEYGKIVPNDEITMCKAILYVAASETTNESSITLCTDFVHETVFLISLLIGVCYLFCYIIMGSVINIAGPRMFSIVLMSVTTLSGVLAQVLSGYTYIQLAISIFLLCAPTITAINAIVVELYPTQIRGMALAISLMFGRLGGMTGTNVAGPLMYTACDYMFYIFGAIHILFILCVILVTSKRFKEKSQNNPS